MLLTHFSPTIATQCVCVYLISGFITFVVRYDELIPPPHVLVANAYQCMPTLKKS